jgi:hypothetical protein
MINVQVEGEYDPERNIVIVKFINRSLSVEDIDYTVAQVEHWAKQGGENKVWAINDISQMGMASPKLFSYYQKHVKPISDKFITDYCVICEKAMERIAAQLFNVLMREKHLIFRTMDEAMEWTLKEQETRGRLIPV